MKWLADENFPRRIVDALRDAGLDVLWIRRECPGIVDQAVLAMAAAQNRVLLTFDKDFGELAFRSRLPADAGVILFRLDQSDASVVMSKVVGVVVSQVDWSGGFAVVDNQRIRFRPLPQRPPEPDPS